MKYYIVFFVLVCATVGYGQNIHVTPYYHLQDTINPLLNLPYVPPSQWWGYNLPDKSISYEQSLSRTFVECWKNYKKSLESKFSEEFNYYLDATKRRKKVEITYSGDTVYFSYNIRGFPQDDMIVKERPTIDGFMKYLEGIK